MTANVGGMILVPKWGNNPAFATAFNSGGVLHSQQNDFDYGAQFAPRVQLGFISGSGLGARVGWWGFGIGNGMASVTSYPAVSAAPLGLQVATLPPLLSPSGLVLAAGSHLEMNVWDFEATECFQCGCWSLLGSAGLRYAHLGQDYLASVYNQAGTNLGNLSSGHGFNGVGPTVSLGGKRHLGSSPFYFYGTGRGSLLFGKANASSTINGLATGDTGPGQTSTGGYDAVMPVAEIEMGFGYYRSLQQRYRIFGEVGVVGMAWFNAGNPSGSYVPPGSPFISASSPTDGTLGLIGLSARCGVNF